MASKISEFEEPLQQEQQQTDVESLDGTFVSLNDSSITRLPPSCSSDTEFELSFEQLLDSQFPSTSDSKPSSNKKHLAKAQKVRGSTTVEEVKKDVARWLNRSPDGCKLVAPPEEFRCSFFSGEEVEKTAAVLKDSIKNEPFKPSAWTEAEAEQEVPPGDFKSNFYNEAKEKPVLTLMYSIKTYCNGQAFLASTPGYLEILQCACGNVDQARLATKCADFDTLESFGRGAYFSELSLSFKKLPKAKRPLVRAVEKFVTKHIKEAQSLKNPVSFTQYAQIPDEVKRCNDERGLQFDPEKLAKYGIVLQRAVHQEMIGRCLDFLRHVGFTLIPEVNVDDDESRNLSSNESALSQPFSSQGSQSGDSPNSFNSQASNLVEDIEIGNEYPFQHRHNALDEVVRYDAQNNPEFIEILRGQAEDAHSPGGSQRSYNSYGSQSLSPLQYSLPEREPPGTIDHTNQDQGDSLDLEQENDFVVFDPEEILLAHNILGGQFFGYDENDEPQRRRPRLE